MTPDSTAHDAQPLADHDFEASDECATCGQGPDAHPHDDASPSSARTEQGVDLPGVHHLKTVEHVWDAVARGEKTAEFRRVDRGFVVGDVLVLQRGTDNNPNNPTLVRRVTHVVRGPDFGIPEGYAMLSIMPHPAALRSRLSPGSEATDDEIARLTALLVKHGIDPKCGCLTDEEAIRQADERKALILAAEDAARRSVSATPDAPTCEHEWKADMAGVDLKGGTATRFFHRCAKCGAESTAPGGGVPADVERLRECWGTVRDTLTSCTEYAEWRANNGGGDSHEVVTLDNHFRALSVPMLTEEQIEDEAIAHMQRLSLAQMRTDRYDDRLSFRAGAQWALASVPPHTEETPHG